MAICYVRCCTIEFCTKIRWLELMLSWQVMGFFKTLNFYHWYSFNLQCYIASTTFRKELDLLSGKQNINKSYVLFTNFFDINATSVCRALKNWCIHLHRKDMFPSEGQCPKNFTRNGTVKFCFGNYYRKSQVSSCPSLKQHYVLFISDTLLSVKLHVITLLAYITAYFWPKILNIGNRDSLKDLIVFSFLDPWHLHVPTVYQQNWKYS